MSHVRRIYAVLVVMEPVVANVSQEKSAGWFDFIFHCVCVFMLGSVVCCEGRNMTSGCNLMPEKICRFNIDILQLVCFVFL